MEFQEKIEANVDRVIVESLEGSGPLAQFLQGKRGEIEESVFHEYNKARTMRGAPEQSHEALQAQVDAQFNDYVRGDGNSVRNALINAAQGDTKAGLDLNDISQLANQGSAVANNFMTGNILGLITSVPSLIANSFIGDYVNAAIKYFFGGENKPDSFGEALAEVRMERGVQAVAAQMSVDGHALSAELLRDVEPALVQPSSRPLSEINTDGVSRSATPDENFHQPNGTMPPGSPGATPAGQVDRGRTASVPAQ